MSAKKQRTRKLSGPPLVSDHVDSIRPPQDQELRERKWRSLGRTLLDRIPGPLGVKAAIIFVLFVGEQALEQRIWGMRGDPRQLALVAYRLTIPLLTVYMILMQYLLRVTVVRALIRLRPSVLAEDDEYDVEVQRTVRRPIQVDIGLLVWTVASDILLYGPLDAPLPLGGPLSEVQQPWQAVYISVMYMLLGWLGLSLVYTAVRHSIGFARLANKPLVVNVYNPENLLPFGSHALMHSLVLAGVIFIPTLLLGRPGSPASLMLIAVNTLGSLMALILPLIGVYRQIRAAKIQSLANISSELTALQTVLLRRSHTSSEDTADLSARASALVTLRKTIQESPNWPFRGTTGVVRAVAAAMSPLIYFVLYEIIRAYIVPLLVESSP